VEEAKALLTYHNEVRVLEKAQDLLSQSANIESH
jgi:hypothetical protein